MISQEIPEAEGTRKAFVVTFPVQYYGQGSVWELLEDPAPRLVFFPVYQQALLVYRVLWDILPHA